MKIIISTCHKPFKKIGGRSVHIFPWDAVKVSTMIQKGAVQTTCCF